VDFLIDLAPDRSLTDLAGLFPDLQDLLDYKVHAVPESVLRLHIRDKLLGEAVPL
jgi:predicted nucleotidyltransferase